MVRLQNRQVPTAPIFCMHVVHLQLYPLHAPTVDARTYFERKNYSCCKYVSTAVRTYLLHIPGTRVTTDVRTHLLHILLFLLVHVRTHSTCCSKYCDKYTPTAQNCCTYFVYLLLYVQLMMCVIIYCRTYFLYLLQVLTDDVYMSITKSRDLPKEKLAADDKVIEADTTPKPKRDRNRAKIMPQ